MSYPIVEARTLYDQSAYHDSAFESYVREWMDRMMPGFPLGLLDTSSEVAFERWEVKLPPRYLVKKELREHWECPLCGMEYDDPSEVENMLCCEPEDGEEPEYIEVCEDEVYVVWDDNYINGEPEEFDDEQEAEWRAQEKENDRMFEDMYGFPWANNWAHYPDDRIKDEELQEAGFVVAYYIGGKGDPREDDSYRLAGVDGGGYGFSLHHFAPLVVLFHEKRSWPVATTQGQCLVTTDYRSALEKLSDAAR